MSDTFLIIALVAWRSIWRNRRRTLITVSSIAFGLSLALFFVAMAEGGYSQLVNDAVRMYAGHVTVEHPLYEEAPAADLNVRNAMALRGRIAVLPGVEGSKSLVLGQGLVKTAAGAVGVAVMGVDPREELEVSPLGGKIVKGDYLNVSDRGKVVIGAELADRLNLKVGRKLVVAGNNVNGDFVEELYRVRGIFKTGSDDADGYLVQMLLGEARAFYGMPRGSVTRLGVILDDPDKRHEIAARINDMPEAAGAAVLPWEKVLPELAAYVKVDRASNWVFQGLLIFLVLFTILNTILMSVLERSREFAVLMALGTSARRVRLQVFMEAVYINLIGCAAGLFAGSLVTYYFMVKGLDFSKMTSENMEVSGFAFSPILHPDLNLHIVGWVGGLVFAATFLLSLYPVWRSTRMRMAEVLR